MNNVHEARQPFFILKSEQRISVSFSKSIFLRKDSRNGVNDKPQDMANYTFQLNSTCQEIHTRTAFSYSGFFFFAI